MTHPSHIDQPGKLYLGSEFIPPATLTDESVQLAIRELTTHAVILGMTGTGKTGLGIALLEEMLLQGVPAGAGKQPGIDRSQRDKTDGVAGKQKHRPEPGGP